MYIYKDTDGQILYVGKAKILKNRVKSYFAPPTTLGPKTRSLVEKVASLETIEVFSEIEALLLESRLISKFKPPFNIAAKDDKSPYYIHITSEKFPKPIVNHESKKAIAGPFLNGYTAKLILKNLRRIAPFCQTGRTNRKCLYAHMGLCNPCPGDPTTSVSDYRKNIVRLKKLLNGEFTQVRSQMARHMAELSRQQQFEQAAKLRNQIQSLDYLLTKPIGPEEFLVNPNLTEDKRQESLSALQAALTEQGLKIASAERIEMYDIANLQGKEATAAMTVAVGGEVNSKHFRHFKIKTKSEPNDVAMMQEVLTRRLRRTDWPLPNLIVLDGGKTQLSIIKNLTSPFPIIALAKKQEVITIPTHSGFVEVQLKRTNSGLKLLQYLRDEAHRFSRRLHHKYRKGSLVPT